MGSRRDRVGGSRKRSEHGTHKMTKRRGGAQVRARAVIARTWHGTKFFFRQRYQIDRENTQEALWKNATIFLKTKRVKLRDLNAQLAEAEDKGELKLYGVLVDCIRFAMSFALGEEFKYLTSEGERFLEGPDW